jgi:CheY-like chemotaxis protein
MKSASVLIIDDDQWLASQHSRLLKAAGYRTHTVEHALAGMEAIDAIHPQAVVLDIFMPGPNGIVLLHELRSHSDLATVPVIICTNSAGDIPLQNLTKYGVVAVLDKSTMRPEDIVVAVRKALL